MALAVARAMVNDPSGEPLLGALTLHNRKRHDAKIHDPNTEDYSDPEAEVWTYAEAGRPLPKPEGYTGPRSHFDYLQTVQKDGEHGDAFGYKTVNSDVAGC